MGDIRIGKVSNVDYDNGMLQVIYTDKDGAITKNLPVVSFNDEYKMPKVGSYVLVAHLSNGSEAGYVLGTYWNEARLSKSTGKGVYRKEFSNQSGKAFAEHKDDSGTLELHAGKIKFSCDAGSITVAQLLDIEKRLSAVEAKV